MQMIMREAGDVFLLIISTGYTIHGFAANNYIKLI